MFNHKNILLSAALTMLAAPVFAGEVAYKEAAARWSAEQAVRIPPALTAEVIKKFKIEQGTAAAAALSEKKAAVTGLVNRFQTCDLTGADIRTAEKYLTPEFKTDVEYFVNGGCAAVKTAAAGIAAQAVQSASLSNLESVSAGGTLSTYQGSSRFFDGSSGRDAEPVTPVAAGAGNRAPAPQVRPAAAPKPLSANVPALSVVPDRYKIERPADLGKDGLVNSSLSYWKALRRENWAAFKKDDASRAEKAKAFLKAAAGAGFGGLLTLSNLPQVEIAAARLGWDVGRGEGAGVIALDAARLAFHSAVFMLVLLPIPVTKVAQAAAAGEPWALALAGGMAAGPINRYILRLI